MDVHHWRCATGLTDGPSHQCGRPRRSPRSRSKVHDRQRLETLIGFLSDNPFDFGDQWVDPPSVIPESVGDANGGSVVEGVPSAT
ncbi:uncharacterized protein METZ01_LOCUS161062 [marine metagenome]|uniref:Uncharacterized protein n=1 Tax=marine metagenome TaxID=408172 RepID=A0A382B377_9ZZZZ